MTYDTYKIATSSGDRAFLQFIYDRMREVHKEDPLLDYMHTLNAFGANINLLIEKAEAYDRLKASLTTIQMSLRW